ncbi:hypothetical protein MARPU_09620 [Marichromatium purpuratum 984]|uniref:Uncharacterized protein n=1 Tax=Marichromatium purpuratum 984 TaxID=765910 RepID=W0E440_MARPU|nr:hypothetical protein [Marichromatium purpuratum]AHF05517.1 hypothetical protein MARPU_09620 [Marichromatium purpuratum 984]
MSSQHTQGPWLTDLQPDDTEVVVRSLDGDVIATVVHRDLADPGRPVVELTDDDWPVYANARLIRAAPTLLAALEHILNTSAQQWSDRDAINAIARHAISEATGGRHA